MCPPTPSSTPTDTPFPYTTLFRSVKRASQRDPLPLSARQTLSTGAEPCVIAMRQREDHIVRAGGNGRLRDQRRISIGFREARDVLRDPTGEQFHFLRQIADMRAKPFPIPLPDIGPNETDLAGPARPNRPSVVR